MEGTEAPDLQAAAPEVALGLSSVGVRRDSHQASKKQMKGEVRRSAVIALAADPDHVVGPRRANRLAHQP